MYVAAGIALLFGIACGGCGNRNAYVPPPPPEVVVGTPVVRTVTLYHEFPGTTQASQTGQHHSARAGLHRQPAFHRRIDGHEGPTAVRHRSSALSGCLRRRASPKSMSTRPPTRTPRPTTPAQCKSPKRPAPSPSKMSTRFKATEEQAKANLELAQANAANAKLNLDFTHITAPLSGKISRRLVDVGNLVTANITLLTTIDQYDPMYAYFNASEADFLDYLKRERESSGREHSGPSSPKPRQNPAAAEGPKLRGERSASSRIRAPNGKDAAPNRASADTENHAVEMGLSDENRLSPQGNHRFRRQPGRSDHGHDLGPRRVSQSAAVSLSAGSVRANSRADRHASQCDCSCPIAP